MSGSLDRVSLGYRFFQLVKYHAFVLGEAGIQCPFQDGLGMLLPHQKYIVTACCRIGTELIVVFLFFIPKLHHARCDQNLDPVKHGQSLHSCL